METKSNKIGLYTQKVVKHFQNPHNMGRIKNPDGVGKVGNIVCLIPSQNIHTNNDLKEINKISNKEKVLSFNGEYDSVIKSIERNYKGKILTIKNQLGEISLTPDHLILGIKIPKGDKFLRTKHRKKLVSAWYHAEELRKGDIILYPIIKQEEDLEYIKINIPKPRWDFKSKLIPNKIPLNADLLRLFGYFLAEGYISDKPCRTFITFTLSIKEKAMVEDIKEISKNLFALETVIRKLPKRKTAIVYLYSARLARFFKRLFGNGAENKKIPDFIMNLPAEKQKSLIYGLWKGDGYVNLKRDGPRAGYSTISYRLTQQIKQLLLRQKIASSIYREKEKRVGEVRHKKNYRIHVGQRNSLKKLCQILNIKYNPKSYISEKAWFDDDYLYIPITRIEKRQYKGKVFNLEIKNTHSFTSDAFCLHNCGDVMYLYIKIGKDRKGREIIKDIKFESYGCLAAIATSSVITDLVKGKTIKQALEVNRQDIVDSLGGLPPIKLHCSVLAADTISEAIYDYLSKNKRPVPKELQKRHQRIMKEKNLIEEKYKEWIKIEEKMPQNN